jgi:hypothetical protein
MFFSRKFILKHCWFVEKYFCRNTFLNSLMFRYIIQNWLIEEREKSFK